jgi:hypothetical protein
VDVLEPGLDGNEDSVYALAERRIVHCHRHLETFLPGDPAVTLARQTARRVRPMVGHGCRDFVRRAPVDEHLDREGPAAVAARARAHLKDAPGRPCLGAAEQDLSDEQQC